jgi:Fe-S oxidoreductase
MEACPVLIEHVPMIVGMRRSLVLEQGRLPRAAETALRSIETRGNPGFGTSHGRLDWAQDMDIPIVSDVGGPNVDILFWVGCAGSLEDRSMRVARSIATVLKRAGVNFAILGPEESCTGDPARRLGNEYLFQMQAEQNIETLNNHQIKKILTMCPHCFNTIRNEYLAFGGEFEVVHHSQFLSQLLSAGRLRLNEDRQGNLGTVTYHDPCYLGRHNGVYDAPREVLSNVVEGGQLVEMGPHRNRAFCCGAGGGHYWFEETEGTERIPTRRTGHAIESGAKTIGTACPYCTQMFELGVLTHGREGEMQVLDIAEIIDQSLVEAPASGSGSEG